MKRRRGFTLVELMVGVSILGILLAIATPGLTRAQRKARETELIADLKALREAAERFNADQGFYPWNIGWLTHDKVGGGAMGYRADGTFVGIPNYAANFRGPYLKMPAHKKWISPYFGSHGEWFPLSPVPGTSFGYTGAPNARGEFIWINGAGTTLDGIPYNEL